jgi:hypothetical protein
MDNSSNPSISFSAEFRSLDSCLKSRWKPFNFLLDEMNNYKPKTLADYSVDREFEIRRMIPLNPDNTVEEITKFVDHNIEVQVDPKHQFIMKFGFIVKDEYSMVTIISHALCEAAINTILAIGLAKNNSQQLFKILENAGLIDKWCYGPRSFTKDYEFPKGTALYESLKKLVKQRNALVHYKINLEMDGKKVFHDSAYESEPYLKQISWTKRFFSLPYDLVEFIDSTIPNSNFRFIFMREFIEKASEHRNI